MACTACTLDNHAAWRASRRCASARSAKIQAPSTATPANQTAARAHHKRAFIGPPPPETGAPFAGRAPVALSTPAAAA